jgi:UDPglucose--hexose-1-phosphate uridylyltransferase
VLPEDGDWRVRVVPNLYPALARQEVVVHSPGHARSIAQLGDDQLELVAEAWQRRRAAEPGGYMQALINEGRAAGSSLPHTHSQLAWLDAAPGPEPPRDGATIGERDGVVAWCPRVSRVAYETAIAPNDGEGGAFASARLGAAVRLLADIVRKLHVLEGTVPLNAWVHDAADGWRIVLFPRLSVLAALELGAGVYINTLAPEDAAERLRD